MSLALNLTEEKIYNFKEWHKIGSRDKFHPHSAPPHPLEYIF
jgi:hypothetical protein